MGKGRTFSRYNQLITFERPDAGVTSFHQPVTSWTPIGTFPAEVRSLSGRELATAQQVRPEILGQIEMRGREGQFTADMRVDFNGRKLAILAIRDPEEFGIRIVIDFAEWKEDL